MKQISGNKLLVKALKEEGVEYVFGYPGACTIDISDELYKQDDVTVILPRQSRITPEYIRPIRYTPSRRETMMARTGIGSDSSKSLSLA